jgi:ATP-dependent Clp protease adaptor protein ClpS
MGVEVEVSDEVIDDLDSLFTYKLVVYNDDVNSFEYVIHCFVMVLSMTPEQAEQCAWLIHTKGKYAVKHGGYHDLEPYCTALQDRQLSAKIE